MSSITPGKLLDGKYEIVSLLGAGGMGEVYKARHVHLNTFRCIKVMRPALLEDETYRARFGNFGKHINALPDSYRRLRDAEEVPIGANTWRKYGVG